VGILTRARLLQALAKQGINSLVSDVMQSEFQPVEPNEMLEAAFRRLQECECRTMPVLRNGRLLGLLTMDNVGEFLSIQAALREASPRQAPIRV
jgi:predicted transcriptional regulator